MSNTFGNQRILTSAALGLAVFVSGPATAQPEPTPVRIERDGLKLELAPLEPDRVRAFFTARGFTAADADHIVATGCVFRSAIGSAYQQAGEPEIRAALAEWRVTLAGEAGRPPQTREDWEAIWKQRGVGEEPATAFYWSLFPTEQTFAPTDYNWGFLTFGLPPGARFDLELAWSSADKVHNARLEGLTCGK